MYVCRLDAGSHRQFRKEDSQSWMLVTRLVFNAVPEMNVEIDGGPKVVRHPKDHFVLLVKSLNPRRVLVF